MRLIMLPQLLSSRGLRLNATILLAVLLASHAVSHTESDVYLTIVLHYEGTKIYLTTLTFNLRP